MHSRNPYVAPVAAWLSMNGFTSATAEDSGGDVKVTIVNKTEQQRFLKEAQLDKYIHLFLGNSIYLSESLLKQKRHLIPANFLVTPPAQATPPTPATPPAPTAANFAAASPLASSALSAAVQSLQQAVDIEKPARVFAANQEAVKAIQRVNGLETAADSLQIKSCIRAEAESQPPQPLMEGLTFDLDLTEVNVRIVNKSQTVSLDQLIRDHCDQKKIDTKGAITTTAPCTLVTTVLAGEYPQMMTKGITQADFVPACLNNTREAQKRVLALSFSVDGSTGIREDFMIVKESMTCLNREGYGGTTALRATEIPNQLAGNLQDQQPDVFKQLQKSACIAVFMEWDLIPDPAAAAADIVDTKSEGTKGQITQGVGGVSVYSVVGKGGKAIDHSHRVHESGKRILTNIHVYVIGAVVVNTEEKTLTEAQATSVVELLQMRLQALEKIYAPYKVAVTYKAFLAAIKALTKPYNIETGTDIFEHAMLRLASIQENPTECHFSPSALSPKYFRIRLGLPGDVIDKMVANLRAKFGESFCERTPKYDTEQVKGIRFPLETVMDKLTPIKENIDAILMDKRNLIAYQRYEQKEVPFQFVKDIYYPIAESMKISTEKSDFFEITFLKMFGCQEELGHARFAPGYDYVSAMLDVHFSLGISEQAARQVVENINAAFPNVSALGAAPARYVRADARVADFGEVDLCEIVVDSALLKSDVFVARFKAAAKEIEENEPLLIEELKMQTGTQSKSSADCAKDLSAVATRLAAVPAAASLVDALAQFSAIITNPRSKRTERQAASYQVTQKVAFFEATQTRDQNRAFKEGDKKEIKQAQKTLFLR